ncbi:MAG: hypothetical protein PHW02_05935, partial [bacterium]|nr:hypothetical protein [bacterium]
ILQKNIFAKAKSQATQFSNTALNQITRELIETSFKLKTASQKRVLVENQISRIPLMADSKDIDEIIRFFKSGVPKQTSQPERRIEKRESQMKIEEPAASYENSKTLFEEFLLFVKREGFLCEILKTAEKKILGENRYLLKMPSSYKQTIDADKLKRLTQEFNPKLQIEIEFDNSEKYSRLLKNKLEDDPNVEKLINDIGGEIIK